jgi:hypothetical protein
MFFGQCRASSQISEQINRQDLPKTIATTLGWHFRIGPKVFPQETKGIQEKSMVKVCSTPIRDDSWERIAEGRFRFPVEIDSKVAQVKDGETIECHAIYTGPSSPKSVLRVPPRAPKSF